MSIDGKPEGVEQVTSAEFADVTFTQKSAYNKLLRQKVRAGKLDGSDGEYFPSAHGKSLTVCIDGHWWTHDMSELFGKFGIESGTEEWKSPTKSLSERGFIQVQTPF